jgi:hypothetical protein
MATKLYPTEPSNINGPFIGAVAVIPSDTVDLVNYCRGIMVSGTGTVTITPAWSPTTSITGTPASVTLTLTAGQPPLTIMASRIWATGTTATGIVALI